MTIIDECIKEIERAGGQVIIVDDEVIVLNEDGDEVWDGTRWRFDLLCIGVHDRTGHSCRVR